MVLCAATDTHTAAHFGRQTAQPKWSHISPKAATNQAPKKDQEATARNPIIIFFKEKMAKSL